MIIILCFFNKLYLNENQYQFIIYCIIEKKCLKNAIFASSKHLYAVLHFNYVHIDSKLHRQSL